jgi:membrane protease YdiL (CAAX protease family)
MVLDWRMKVGPLLEAVILIFIFNLMSSTIYLKTKNVLASIVIHTFWIFPILFFR